MTISKVNCECGEQLQYEWFVCDCSPVERDYFVMSNGKKQSIHCCPKCSKVLNETGHLMAVILLDKDKLRKAFPK